MTTATTSDKALILATLFCAIHGVDALRAVLANKEAEGCLDEIDREVLALLDNPKTLAHLEARE